MCNDFTNEYNQASGARKEELRLLSTIRTKIEERFGEVPEGDDLEEAEAELSGF